MTFASNVKTMQIKSNTNIIQVRNRLATFMTGCQAYNKVQVQAASLRPCFVRNAVKSTFEKSSLCLVYVWITSAFSCRSTDFLEVWGRGRVMGGLKKVAATADACISFAAEEEGRGRWCTVFEKLRKAEWPFKHKATTSCAWAAISGVEKVPSQMRDIFLGSLISRGFGGIKMYYLLIPPSLPRPLSLVSRK